MSISRRKVLAGAGAAVGAAQACKPEPGGDTGTPEGRIDHVIVVMMENRSFDHFLGGMKLLEGREDIDGVTAEMSNPDAGGMPVSVYPNEIGCIDDPHHGWNSSHDQFNGGANDGFVRDYGGPGVMQYMARADLPITWALADNFAICDRWFCSVMGPTWPNRFYGHCGTSDGMSSNDMPPGGSYPLPNVWAHLTEAGVDWRYYYTDLPFVFLIEGVYDPSSPSHFEDFVAHAEAGRLPSVCWLDPGFSFNDDHPPHHVAMGQEFLAAVIKAISSSATWERCLLIITYDEHGGFFDHVPPPTTDDDHAAEGFDQLGFRVPTLLVGPWVKQGVCSTVFDHTSWLKFICDTHGIEPWTKRIAAANSIAEAIDFDRMARNEPLAPVELPAFDYDESLLGDECSGDGVFARELPELWQDIFTAVFREDERSLHAREISEWIRAYNRGKAPPFRRRPSSGG
jgi:phospholipase C